MSQSYRKQNVPYIMEKVIINCCNCGLQFILETILINEDDEDIQIMDQCKVNFCPYCGKDHRKK